MGNFPFGPNPDLQLQATTGTAGYTLADSTGTILSWTAPDDGNMHRVLVFAVWHCTSAATGGAFGLAVTIPDDTQHTFSLNAGNNSVGYTQLEWPVYLIYPGTTVTLEQTSSLTAGAEVLWAELWGS